MKKLLALILAAALALSLVACGGNEKTKGTELTVDNYAQYLNLIVQGYGGEPKLSYPKGVDVSDSFTAMLLNGSIIATLRTEGTSTNFNYNDVRLKVKVIATYNSDSLENKFADIRTNTNTHEFEFEVTTDISGTAKQVDDTFKLSGEYTCNEIISVDYEVIEISGTVTPA